VLQLFLAHSERPVGVVSGITLVGNARGCSPSFVIGAAVITSRENQLVVISLINDIIVAAPSDV